MAERFYIETLGCPKNQVDSDKLAGSMLAAGLERGCGSRRRRPRRRQHLRVHRGGAGRVDRDDPLDRRRAPRKARASSSPVASPHAPEPSSPRRCQRSTRSSTSACRSTSSPGAAGDRKGRHRSVDGPARAVPDPGRGTVGLRQGRRGLRPALRILCDPELSRPTALARREAILAEVDALDVHKRSCSLPRTSPATDVTAAGRAPSSISFAPSASASSECASFTCTRPRSPTSSSTPSSPPGFPYFDLSLQHVSRPLLRQMRRFGSAERFLSSGSTSIRAKAPEAALRSSFILGYPGETEEDHDELLAFLREAELDWAGFFTFSDEAGTYAQHVGRTRSPPRWRSSDCARRRRSRTRSRSPAGASLVGTTTRGARRCAGRVALAPRGPRDRRRDPRRRSPGAGFVHEVCILTADGMDLFGAAVSLDEVSSGSAVLARSQ